MSKVSFAKVEGAGASAPVSGEAKPANAELENNGGQPQQLPVPAPKQDRAPAKFYGGDEEDSADDRSDVRLPRLNIIQGLSGPELKEIKMPDGKNAPDGSLILKKALYIPQPARIVVAAFSRKTYAEKMVKYGEGKPRYFDSLVEVNDAGGTDQWRLSRENRNEDGVPASKKPWFVPMVTGLLLIQKWDGLRPEDEAHFTAVSEDGVAFAPCVFTVKSTSFGAFYVPLKSEQVTGVLNGGFYTRYVKLTTRQNKAFEPAVTILEPTSEPVRVLARNLRA